jgi:hypothetical protein
MQLLYLAIILVVVYIRLYSPLFKNSQHTSKNRDCTACNEPVTKELIFTTKKTSLRTGKSTTQLDIIAFDVVFYISVLVNIYLVFICCGIISHGLKYPTGTGFGILAVYFFGFFVWCITIWQVATCCFIFYLKNNRKHLLAVLPGLIISVVGFLIFNYYLMLAFSD